MSRSQESQTEPVMPRLFAARGWVLVTPLVIVLIARLLTPATESPLKPEWLIYVAAAIALRLWAGAHLGDHGNAAHAHAPQLTRTGPYRFSRNPLYIANILAAAGLIMFANALPLPAELALIVFVILHHVLLVRHEETTLAALFGDDYARYRDQVPRWYGLMRPRSLDAGRQEDGGVITLPTLLRRQGRNVAYMVLCVALIGAAARAG